MSLVSAVSNLTSSTMILSGKGLLIGLGSPFDGIVGDSLPLTGDLSAFISNSLESREATAEDMFGILIIEVSRFNPQSLESCYPFLCSKVLLN